MKPQVKVPRLILSAYVYQFLYQLPQLLVIPVLAKLLPASELVVLAKYLLIINLISMISDWGYSTIGSQKLFMSLNDRISLYAIFLTGERVRFTVLVALCAICILWIYITHPHEFALMPATIIVLGSLSTALIPNWLVVGTHIYNQVIPIILATRIVSIILLVYVAIETQHATSSLVVYFSILTIFSIIIRKVSTRQLFLTPYEGNKTSIIPEFKSGLLIMLGSLLCYGYLNTGVLFVERLAGASNAASFVIAERVLVVARAMFSPFIQYLFVVSGSEYKTSRLLLPIVVLGTFLVWVVGKATIFYIFKDTLANEYFNILIVGFLFLGLSHHYITLKILGKGYVSEWLVILFIAFIIYISCLLYFSNNLHFEGGYATSLSIISAEFTIFLLGFLFSIFRMKHERL